MICVCTVTVVVVLAVGDGNSSPPTPPTMASAPASPPTAAVPPPPLPPPPLLPGHCLPMPEYACVRNSVAQQALRNASLSCLVRYANVTADFGLRDSGSWEEYSPRCVSIGGEEFLAAEPLNAESSLAFDQIACHTELGPAASLLGFGSFAFHASGGHPLTGHWDVVPMNCLGATLVHLILERTKAPVRSVTTAGITYDFTALAGSCAEDMAALVHACDLADDAMVTGMQTIRRSLPPLKVSVGVLAYSILEKCYGRTIAEGVLQQLLATNDLDVQIADYKLQLGGTDSIFLLAGACIQATTAFSTFASALSVQGQNGGGSQQHDVWHRRVAEALNMAVAVEQAWPAAA